MIFLSEDVDKILNELKGGDKPLPPSEENADQLLEKIQEERRSKIDSFQLKLTLEEDEPSESGAEEAPQAENTVPQEGKTASSSRIMPGRTPLNPNRRRKRGRGFLPPCRKRRGIEKTKEDGNG